MEPAEEINGGVVAKSNEGKNEADTFVLWRQVSTRRFSCILTETFYKAIKYKQGKKVMVRLREFKTVFPTHMYDLSFFYKRKM